MTPARLVLDLILLAIILAIVGLFVSVLWMPLSSYHGPFQELKAEEKQCEARLRRDVQVLAGDIGKRHTPENLEKTVGYLKDEFRAMGLVPATQTYRVDKQDFENVEAEIKGTGPEVVIVCAHYDSVVGTVGANDNASGVAATLEIARILSAKKPSLSKTVRFVVFGTEEPPYFSSKDMGSYHYAARCKERGENVVALLDMETLAYYSDEQDSQRYPISFVPGYPNTGNFITFVGNQKSRKLVEKCISTFRETTQFPSEGVAAPEWVNGVDWADQYWFWKAGYPGVMITDTAPYRYPYYHDIKDTPEKLTYPKFARVVYGLSNVVAAVAE